MGWVILAAFACACVWLFWWGRPPQCETCLRRLGPPTAGELGCGQPIGCPSCNLNLRRVPFGWFDKDWNPCDAPKRS
jgi:hypothetical protein